MVEVDGVVSSIIAIANLGAKLSKSLYSAGDWASHADSNLNRVASNVALFSGTLKYFATVLQSNERLFSDEARNVVEDLLLECDDVFEHLAELAVMAQRRANKNPGGSELPAGDGRRQRRLSISDKFRSYFEGPKVEVLLASLEYLKSTLQLLIQTLLLAAATADAKERQKAEAATMPANVVNQIQLERIHVENHIIARQLSMTTLNRRRAEQNYSEPQNESLSPTISESSSVADTRHNPQLLEAPPSSHALTMGSVKSIPLLDQIISNGCILPRPRIGPCIQTPQSRDEIIDQLLGSWTRLSEVEQEIEIAASARFLPRGSSPLARLEVQGTSAHRGSVLAVSEVQSPAEMTGSLDYLQPMSNGGEPGSLTRSIPPPPKGPAPSSRSSLSSKVPLSRSTSSPMASAHQWLEPASPQSSDSRISAVRGSPRDSHESRPIASEGQIESHATYPPLRPTDEAVANRLHSNYRRPEYETLDEDSSAETSELEDEESSLKVYWTIRSLETMPRRWDMMDGKVIGPRTPLIPVESVDWLARNIRGVTVIQDDWVAEQALTDAQLEYKHESRHDGENDLVHIGDARKRYWLIPQVLRWAQVEQLVNRTVEIFDARSRTMPTSRRATTTDPASQNRQRVPLPMPMPMPMPTPMTMRPPSSSQSHADSNPYLAAKGAPGANGRPVTRAPPYPSGNEYIDTAQSQRPSSGTLPNPGPRRSPRAPMEGVGYSASPLQERERNVRFSQAEGGPRMPNAPPPPLGAHNSASSTAPKPRDSNGPRGGPDLRRQNSRDHHNHSDSSEADKRDRRARAKKDKERDKHQKHEHNKKAAKVLASIAGVAAMLEGLDAAF